MSQLKFTARRRRGAALLPGLLVGLCALLLPALSARAQRQPTPRPPIPKSWELPPKPAARKPAAAAAKKKAPAAAAATTRRKTATCDDLAAHPEDRGRKGPGVEDDKIAPAAVETCTLAVRQNPDEPRLHFQLGRAYWAAGRHDEALDSFLKAEESGYAPAYFYLGQAYERGLVEGRRADPAAARNLYVLAAAEEFGPAVRAYQELMSFEPDFSEFKQPAFLQALYEGNFDELNKTRMKAIFYVQGIHKFLALTRADFEDADPACPRIVDSATSNELERVIYVAIFGRQPDNSLEGAFAAILGMQNKAFDPNFYSQLAVAEELVLNGTDDFYLFSYDYGACDGPAVERLYANIKRFVAENPAATSR